MHVIYRLTPLQERRTALHNQESLLRSTARAGDTYLHVQTRTPTTMYIRV